MSTQFFTNRGNNTLMREFEGVLSSNPTISNFDAVVGFLRASGYFVLRPFLSNIQKVRILIGINVDKYMVQAARRGILFMGAPDEVKQDYLRELKKDIESSHYAKEVEEGILQMLQDIADGKLELRAHPSKKIHAKLYILYPDNYNQHSLTAAAITGSSNLSGNGLGISEEQQYEFNVRLNRYEDVCFAREEFELLWKEAEGCPITCEDVDATLQNTYIKKQVTPYEIYIKMLMEYFSDRVLQTDMENPFDMPEGYQKFDYQADAVAEGYQKLIKYNGFILADVVGLGKTIVATMIAKKFLIENGRDNTKILVVYPPAVEQNWKSTFKDFGIDPYTRFISNGSLNKILDEENYDYWNSGDYDLVLVDEAHKFRTNSTGAFQQLQEICKMPRIRTGNVPGVRKKVMLISATPMNNSPADIMNEILLFQDARRCTIEGVSNLTAFFNPLIKEFKQLRKNPQYDLKAFKQLAEQVRDRIIKPLTVRRTRTDIESIPRYSKDVGGFPKVAAPIENKYELNERLATLFEEAMMTLTVRLKYARYQAIAYLLPEKSEGLYDNAELVSRSLASIRKNGLVKRLESSFYAFQKSIKRFCEANQYMIDMFERDKVFIAPDLDINHLYDLGLSDEEIEERLNEKAENNPKNACFKAADFRPEFIEMLRYDQKLLQQMNSDWEGISDSDDSKFYIFHQLLQNELFDTERNPEQKLVVFSESLDTVEYLLRRIGRSDVLAISADNRGKLYKTIRENFDANAKTKKNEYNIIVTTDVLAEGVNLHRSNIIINYDTPWNSTKLMQRIGRVNRIGSSSPYIYNYVFYPSREGNREIHLNQIALSKIQTFHTTFGEDNQIYSKQEIIDRDIDKLFSEGQRQEKEEFNKEIPFYEELRSLYMSNRKEYNRIAELSLRSRVGRTSTANPMASGETLVFLKNNHKKSFYKASDTKAEELSPIEALSYFKSTPDEAGVPLIEQHHTHVEKARKQFFIRRSEELQNEERNERTTGNHGRQIGEALSLLEKCSRFIEDENTRRSIVQLKELVEHGVISHIAKRLQRIQKELMQRRTNFEEALKEIVEMAQKYEAYFSSRKNTQEEQETEIEIILSESFS